MDNQQERQIKIIQIPEMQNYFADKNGVIYSTKKSLKLKTLKPHIHYGKSKNPYMRIKVNQKNYLVHRLLASIQIGRQLLKSEFVNHKDGVTDNNRLNNLEVVSHIENVKHAIKNGLYCSGKDWYKARC
jgi:hypothetical protein